MQDEPHPSCPRHYSFQNKTCYVAADCKLLLDPARVLSIAPCTLTPIDWFSRDRAKSLHTFWPIRTPCPTCTNQGAWAVVTPKRPKANFKHAATRNAQTRTPQATPDTRLLLLNIYFSAPPLNCRWPLCLSDFGNEGDSQQVFSIPYWTADHSFGKCVYC